MQLSDAAIRYYCKHIGLINPFMESYKHESGMSGGLTCVGYDIHLGQDLYIEPGETTLSVSLEHFDMPDDIAGAVYNKSTLAREFLLMPVTQIEPGWNGYLTLELINNNKRKTFDFKKGAPIGQIIFTKIDMPVDQPYNGKYQNQPDMAVPAIYRK